MKIRDVLKKKGGEVQTIGAQQRLSDAVTRFSCSKCRCLVVTEGERAVGMLTIRDTLLHLDREGGEALGHEVNRAISKRLFSVTPESTVEEAHALLTEEAINHLPVLENGRLVGLVTRVDILANQVHDVEDANALMLDYISGSYF